MEEEGKFRVDKFNGQNYQLWKMQMEDYLYQKYMYLSLGGKAKQPAVMKDEEWEVLDRKALGTIRLFASRWILLILFLLSFSAVNLHALHMFCHLLAFFISCSSLFIPRYDYISGLCNFWFILVIS